MAKLFNGEQEVEELSLILGCRYISAEELPVQYGGFKREKDFEFANEESTISEITVKAGSTGSIELPVEEVTMLVGLLT